MVNDNESKILNVKLTQEKIKSIVNVTYSQPVSYFRKNIKLEIIIEMMLIIFSLLCFIARGACETLAPNTIKPFIAIVSNSITVFSIIYFLLAIYDSILGLWDLIEANNKK